MSVNVTLSDEMEQQFQKLAEIQHVPMDALIETALSDYLDEQLAAKEVADLTPTEIEELKVSFERGEDQIKAGVCYTQEDMHKLLNDLVQEHVNNLSAKKGKQRS